MRITYYLPVILFSLIFILANCNQYNESTNKFNQQTKQEIEKKVREYWQKQSPKDKVIGLSFQKYSDDLYLVGTTFENSETNSINVVARKFELNSQSVWKIEPFNDRWQSILRLSPEK